MVISAPVQYLDFFDNALPPFFGPLQNRLDQWWKEEAYIPSVLLQCSARRVLDNATTRYHRHHSCDYAENKYRFTHGPL